MNYLKSAIRFPLVLRARARNAMVDRRVRDELAVAAIFKDEAPFLDDWLTFHSGIGVSHFYLYNNFSTDQFRDVLQPWIARRRVTLHDWPVSAGQMSAYRHCVRHKAGDVRWIAFIDIDEFLFSPRQLDIRPILREYSDLPGILVHSPYFGSSGHRERPASLIFDAYTRRAPLNLVSCKTIANPRLVYAMRNAHQFKYLRGEALDTSRNRVDRSSTPVLDVLRLNHYWSRSLQDLQNKSRRGDVFSPTPPSNLAQMFEFEAQLNSEEDRSIIPIANAVFGHSDRGSRAAGFSGTHK
jgi:hypothetical protein